MIDVAGGSIVEALGKHDKSGFASGIPELDGYFQKQASQDIKKYICYLCFNEE